ncbi:hypothetical protein [Methylibium sp.]|uniref:hypothetical protein n=1 Tax=Methylibium sp. TaxID=2067992 RepID=UPI003D0D0BAD
MPADLDTLETRVHVLEAVMLALVRMHPAADPLLAEFDRAIARLATFLDHAGQEAALQRLRQQAERVRLQIEPE